MNDTFYLFRLTFSIASKSDKLKYPFKQNQNQKRRSLLQHCPTGFNAAKTV
jgi:hypothetical protein